MRHFGVATFLALGFLLTITNGASGSKSPPPPRSFLKFLKRKQEVAPPPAIVEEAQEVIKTEDEFREPIAEQLSTPPIPPKRRR